MECSFYSCYKSAFSQEILRVYPFYCVVFEDFEKSIDKTPLRLEYKKLFHSLCMIFKILVNIRQLCLSVLEDVFSEHYNKTSRIFAAHCPTVLWRVGGTGQLHGGRVSNFLIPVPFPVIGVVKRMSVHFILLRERCSWLTISYSVGVPPFPS